MDDDTALRLAFLRALVRSGMARELRLDAELSCGDVGRSVGTDQANIWRWETGQRRPTGEAALRYEAFLRAVQKQRQQHRATAS